MTIVLLSKQTKLQLDKPAGTILPQNSAIAKNSPRFCTPSVKGVHLSRWGLFSIPSNTKRGTWKSFLCDKNKGLQSPFSVYWELCHSLWGTESSTSPPWSEGQKPPSAWVSKAQLPHRTDLRLPSPHFLEALQLLYVHLTQIRLSTQCRRNTHGYPCWNKWKWALHSIRDHQISIEKVDMCSPQNSSPIHRLYWT